MDPSKYTVLVGDVAFHIRNRRATLAGAWVGAWAWQRPIAATRGNRRTSEVRRRVVIGMLQSTKNYENQIRRRCEVDYTVNPCQGAGSVGPLNALLLLRRAGKVFKCRDRFG